MMMTMKKSWRSLQDEWKWCVSWEVNRHTMRRTGPCLWGPAALAGVWLGAEESEIGVSPYPPCGSGTTFPIFTICMFVLLQMVSGWHVVLATMLSTSMLSLIPVANSPALLNARSVPTFRLFSVTHQSIVSEMSKSTSTAVVYWYHFAWVQDISYAVAFEAKLSDIMMNWLALKTPVECHSVTLSDGSVRCILCRLCRVIPASSLISTGQLTVSTSRVIRATTNCSSVSCTAVFTGSSYACRAYNED